MSENCNHECGSCSTSCDERTQDPKSLLEETNGYSSVGKVIGIVSGKGGVGKSLVTSMLATEMTKKGYQAAILDADITGPSIPRMFGLRRDKAQASELGLNPVSSLLGAKIMSVNLILENEEDPVLWRGPLIGGVIKQFWTDVIWGDVDYMFIDMPPGTGDAALTVFQSIPLDGLIIVASPQELVSMIVSKAVNMAVTMNVPILGLVENMSYVECPDCGKKISVFGESSIQKVADEYNLDVLARIPMDPKLAAACDKGEIENFRGDWLKDTIYKIETI